MQIVVALVTCASFLFHILAGCCAHHAHGHGAITAVAAADSGDEIACHHHSGHSHHCHGPSQHELASPSQPSDEPCQDGPCEDSCDGETCTYVVPGKVTLPVDSTDEPLPLEANLAATQTKLVTVAGHPEDWLGRGPPCRVHLMHCVFLI